MSRDVIARNIIHGLHGFRRVRSGQKIPFVPVLSRLLAVSKVSPAQQLPEAPKSVPSMQENKLE